MIRKVHSGISKPNQQILDKESKCLYLPFVPNLKLQNSFCKIRVIGLGSVISKPYQQILDKDKTSSAQASM